MTVRAGREEEKKRDKSVRKMKEGAWKQEMRMFVHKSETKCSQRHSKGVQDSRMSFLLFAKYRQCSRFNMTLNKVYLLLGWSLLQDFVWFWWHPMSGKPFISYYAERANTTFSTSLQVTIHIISNKQTCVICIWLVLQGILWIKVHMYSSHLSPLKKIQTVQNQDSSKQNYGIL